MNIIADKSIPFIGHFFNSIGDLTLLDSKEISHSVLKNTDVLLVRTVTQVNQELLKGTSIQYVATATSGYDHIDIDYLNTKGIGFAHAPGCNARSVAEYVLSSLFVISELMNFELINKSVAIIGCGNVGSIVSSFIKKLGLDCQIYDPPRQENEDKVNFSTLEDIKKADIITIHVPLVRQGPYKTSNLINADFLSGLKSNVVLINTSRGGVIDEKSLCHFIDSNSDCSVVLDVWKNEPDINIELLNKVSIATPHIAGYSLDGKFNGTYEIYKKVCDYFKLEINKSKLICLPEYENNHIQLGEYDSEIDAIKMATLSSYDVRTDSAALSHLQNVDDHNKAGYFAELRNNYSTRREFFSMTVSLPERNNSLQRKMEILGFNI
ncbi:MAG: erythronate-4-phosphate dehydrogenase [Gammaproteobacteria bacterium]|jgi:erythronate-4-phosphate dehydrogenase